MRYIIGSICLLASVAMIGMIAVKWTQVAAFKAERAMTMERLGQ